MTINNRRYRRRANEASSSSASAAAAVVTASPGTGYDGRSVAADINPRLLISTSVVVSPPRPKPSPLRHISSPGSAFSRPAGSLASPQRGASLRSSSVSSGSQSGSFIAAGAGFTPSRFDSCVVSELTLPASTAVHTPGVFGSVRRTGTHPDRCYDWAVYSTQRLPLSYAVKQILSLDRVRVAVDRFHHPIDLEIGDAGRGEVISRWFLLPGFAPTNLDERSLDEFGLWDHFIRDELSLCWKLAGYFEHRTELLLSILAPPSAALSDAGVGTTACTASDLAAPLPFAAIVKECLSRRGPNCGGTAPVAPVSKTALPQPIWDMQRDAHHSVAGLFDLIHTALVRSYVNRLNDMKERKAAKAASENSNSNSKSKSKSRAKSSPRVKLEKDTHIITRVRSPWAVDAPTTEISEISEISAAAELSTLPATQPARSLDDSEVSEQLTQWLTLATAGVGVPARPAGASLDSLRVGFGFTTALEGVRAIGARISDVAGVGLSILSVVPNAIASAWQKTSPPARKSVIRVARSTANRGGGGGVPSPSPTAAAAAAALLLPPSTLSVVSPASVATTPSAGSGDSPFAVSSSPFGLSEPTVNAATGLLVLNTTDPTTRGTPIPVSVSTPRVLRSSLAHSAPPDPSPTTLSLAQDVIGLFRRPNTRSRARAKLSPPSTIATAARDPDGTDTEDEEQLRSRKGRFTQKRKAESAGIAKLKPDTPAPVSASPTPDSAPAGGVLRRARLMVARAQRAAARERIAAALKRASAKPKAKQPEPTKPEASDSDAAAGPRSKRKKLNASPQPVKSEKQTRVKSSGDEKAAASKSRRRRTKRRSKSSDDDQSVSDAEDSGGDDSGDDSDYTAGSSRGRRTGPQSGSASKHGSETAPLYHNRFNRKNSAAAAAAASGETEHPVVSESLLLDSKVGLKETLTFRKDLKRKNHSPEVVRVFSEWLAPRLKTAVDAGDPILKPSRAQQTEWSAQLSISMKQIQNWFINFRTRFKKGTIAVNPRSGYRVPSAVMLQREARARQREGSTGAGGVVRPPSASDDDETCGGGGGGGGANSRDDQCGGVVPPTKKQKCEQPTKSLASKAESLPAVKSELSLRPKRRAATAANEKLKLPTPDETESESEVTGRGEGGGGGSGDDESDDSSDVYPSDVDQSVSSGGDDMSASESSDEKKPARSDRSRLRPKSLPTKPVKVESEKQAVKIEASKPVKPKPKQLKSVRSRSRGRPIMGAFAAAVAVATAAKKKPAKKKGSKTADSRVPRVRIVPPDAKAAPADAAPPLEGTPAAASVPDTKIPGHATVSPIPLSSDEDRSEANDTPAPVIAPHTPIAADDEVVDTLEPVGAPVDGLGDWIAAAASASAGGGGSRSAKPSPARPLRASSNAGAAGAGFTPLSFSLSTEFPGLPMPDLPMFGSAAVMDFGSSPSFAATDQSLSSSLAICSATGAISFPPPGLLLPFPLGLVSPQTGPLGTGTGASTATASISAGLSDGTMWSLPPGLCSPRTTALYAGTLPSASMLALAEIGKNGRNLLEADTTLSVGSSSSAAAVASVRPNVSSHTASVLQSIQAIQPPLPPPPPPPPPQSVLQRMINPGGSPVLSSTLPASAGFTSPALGSLGFTRSGSSSGGTGGGGAVPTVSAADLVSPLRAPTFSNCAVKPMQLPAAAAANVSTPLLVRSRTQYTPGSDSEVTPPRASSPGTLEVAHSHLRVPVTPRSCRPRPGLFVSPLALTPAASAASSLGATTIGAAPPPTNLLQLPLIAPLLPPQPQPSQLQTPSTLATTSADGGGGGGGGGSLIASPVATTTIPRAAQTTPIRAVIATPTTAPPARPVRRPLSLAGGNSAVSDPNESLSAVRRNLLRAFDQTTTATSPAQPQPLTLESPLPLPLSSAAAGAGAAAPFVAAPQPVLSSQPIAPAPLVLDTSGGGSGTSAAVQMLRSRSQLPVRPAATMWWPVASVQPAEYADSLLE